MISSKDISVVVQGAISDKYICNVLKSVRQWLPESEIIISSWKGTDLHGLDYDKFVLSDDVGGYKSKITGIYNNISRQIVSTRKGVELASKPYVLKIRSDLVLTSCNFLKFFHSFPKRDDKYQCFKERILFVSCFFKKYIGERKSYLHPVPYHISDWLMFGAKEDIRNLFNIPIVDNDAFYEYFEKRPPGELKPYCFKEQHQLTPEQYILEKYLSNRLLVRFPECKDLIGFNSDNLFFFEKFVASNCIILDTDQFGVYCAKNDGTDPYRTWSMNSSQLPYPLWEGLYTHYEFLKDYRKYCDIKFKIPVAQYFNLLLRLIKSRKVSSWLFYH